MGHRLAARPRRHRPRGRRGRRRDATHAVAGLAGAAPATEDTLVVGPRAGCGAPAPTGFGLALPVDGDPVGLGGPRAFNAAALEAGEAVVVDGAGRRAWCRCRARRRASPGRRTPPSAASCPTSARPTGPCAPPCSRPPTRSPALDVARWRPEVADRLMNLRHRAPPRRPRGVPPRCVDLAARGLQALEIVDLALEDDGGAVTAYEIESRRAALRPLERAGPARAGGRLLARGVAARLSPRPPRAIASAAMH